MTTDRPRITQTMANFGHPRTQIAEYRWWSVLLRPKQVTLGSLILAAKCDVSSFGALPAEAFAELSRAARDIEAALGAFCRFEKINYLMLMMTDPEPHFHVLPRYAGERRFESFALPDRGWPGPPRLDAAVPPPDDISAGMALALRAAWPAASP